MLRKVLLFPAVVCYNVAKGVEAMNKKLLPQEGLKLIACCAMLIDHIGAVLLPSVWLRLVGRLAFPIFCFLLAEGAHRTKSPLKYALRLVFGMLISEVPYDLLFIGSGSPGISLRFLTVHGIVWQRQSVMVTLLAAFLAMQLIKRIRPLWGKLLAILPFALLAELAKADYGFWGVCMAAMFFITHNMHDKHWIQAAFTALICLAIPSTRLFGFPIQMFGIAAMIPISLYSGRKITQGRAAQWGFYLFYPAHMLLLYGIAILFFA